MIVCGMSKKIVFRDCLDKERSELLRACLASFMASLRACFASFYAQLRGCLGCFVGILHATLCLQG